MRNAIRPILIRTLSRGVFAPDSDHRTLSHAEVASKTGATGVMPVTLLVRRTTPGNVVGDRGGLIVVRGWHPATFDVRGVLVHRNLRVT